MLDTILNDFWFKKADSFELTGEYEADSIIEYIREFQKGSFDRKGEFVNFFLNSTENNVFIIGMRLFMAIASHNDFELLETFLGECEEDELRVFLAFVEESMSLHVIPYLLSLYEIWSETEVGSDIAECICDMLGYAYDDEQE